MKIAFIRDAYDAFGGAERFTQALMDRFSSQGAQIHIFARKWSCPSRSNIVVHKINALRWPSLFRHASFVYLAGKAVRNEAFDLVLSNERTLCQDIYRAGDGVHAQWLHNRSIYYGFIRRLTIKYNPFHRYLLWLERQMFEDPALKAVIVNSDMVRREITSRFNIQENRIHTIYNGVDMTRFDFGKKAALGTEFRKELGVDEQKKVFLFLGSGYRRKGLQFAIEGLAKSASGIKSLLWVVGKGDPSRYRKLAEKKGVGDNVIFWGPRSDVEKFYAAADAFILPAIYDPFPSVIIEAMASGLPVITTRQCGAAEIISHGVDGFILPVPHAVGDIAGYIDILSGGRIMVKMGEAAWKTARTFTIERTVSRIEALYLSIVGNERI